NYNFSTFTFDPVEVFAGGGSFSVTSNSVSRFSDELMPVTPTDRYRLSMYAKWDGDEQPRMYLGLVFQDIDGHNIMPRSHRRTVDARLAAPLTPGDTVIYLDDATGWEN